MNPGTIWLSSKELVPHKLVGGKGRGLLRLTSLGLPVPPGFILTTRFFSSANGHNLTQTQQAQIEKCYKTLGQLIGEPEPVVAIRSSATGEDGRQHSFAGLFDTFLSIMGAQTIFEKVSLCQQSVNSSRATNYRSKLKVQPVPRMAVVVQAMVPARSSGVLMTLNPSNGDRSKIVIESTWGLGQPLVEGAITPDRFLIDKITGEVIERTIVPKPKALCRQSGHNDEMAMVAVPTARQELPSLTEAELEKLVDYGRFLENHFGAPQDIEYATTAEKIFLLQARPETAWSQKQQNPLGLTDQPVDQIIKTLTNLGKR